MKGLVSNTYISNIHKTFIYAVNQNINIEFQALETKTDLCVEWTSKSESPSADCEGSPAASGR